MLRRTILTLLLTTYPLTAIPQTKPTTDGIIEGVVTDEAGGIIANTRIFLHSNQLLSDDAPDKIELGTTTDAKGAFQLSLPSGPYDIIVSKNPWQIYAKTILLKPKGIVSLKIKLSLPKDMCDWPGVNCDTFK